MSEQIVESLKEWFEKEWLYERHLTTAFVRDKEAFQRGCEYFDSHNYAFKGELLIQLRKEAGLAEVTRSNHDLEKYATHCFRQVEKVFSEFLVVKPGRKKIGEYLLDGNDMVHNPSIIMTLNSSVSNLLSHTYKGQLNFYCLILKLNYIKKIKNYCYTAPDESHFDEAVKTLSHKEWQFSQSQQEKIFKAVLYFDPFGSDKSLSAQMNLLQHKPSLYAYNHMYHFRNLGSHLNSQSSPLKMPETPDETERYRIQPFYKEPMQVMDNQMESPGFYQRYVDMVLYLYSEYFKNSFLK